jgi:hypothetical protein
MLATSNNDEASFLGCSSVKSSAKERRSDQGLCTTSKSSREGHTRHEHEDLARIWFLIHEWLTVLVMLRAWQRRTLEEADSKVRTQTCVERPYLLEGPEGWRRGW